MPNATEAKSSPTQERDDSALHEIDSAVAGIVYVNEIARHAMLNERKPKFPVGSVIVREKLALATDATPQSLVVMVKRESGFNSKANDWEFLMIDGSVSKITHREKQGSCQDCHKRQKDNDFVFRTYLTESVRLKQK